MVAYQVFKGVHHFLEHFENLIFKDLILISNSPL